VEENAAAVAAADQDDGHRDPDDRAAVAGDETGASSWLWYKNRTFTAILFGPQPLFVRLSFRPRHRLALALTRSSRASMRVGAKAAPTTGIVLIRVMLLLLQSSGHSTPLRNTQKTLSPLHLRSSSARF
jgi:hypothetical protein